MSEKRRGLGRGLGALIPSGNVATRPPGDRPVDVFFPDREEGDTSGQGEPSAAEATTAEGAATTGTSTEAPAGEKPTDDAAQDAASSAEGDAATQEDGGDGGDAATAGGAAAARPAQTPEAPQPTPGVPDADGLLPVPGATFAELPVDAVVPNPRQPRQVFDEEALAELVHSVREIGVLQPVVVRPARGTDGRYELIMGERRWRAAREAGLERVPAIVRDTADDDLLRDALLENLHRSELNPLEEAAAYQQLLDDFGCTHDELATRLGRSRPQISNTIRLMRLPPAVQRRVAAGVLSAGHARALLALEDSEAMERLAQRIVSEGLSVRAVEEIISLGDTPGAPQRKKPRPGAHSPELSDLATRLGDRLDTRVTITLGRNKGRLSVEFASVEDLNRIVGVLAPEERGAFRAGR